MVNRYNLAHKKVSALAMGLALSLFGSSLLSGCSVSDDSSQATLLQQDKAVLAPKASANNDVSLVDKALNEQQEQTLKQADVQSQSLSGNNANVAIELDKEDVKHDVSAQDAFILNQELVSMLQDDYELILQVSSQLDKSNIYDSHLQPVNKNTKCLVPFMVAQRDGISLYWDGACQNGLATGIGRLVRTENGRKTHEFLMEVVSPVKLHTWLNYDFRTMDVETGFSELKLEKEHLVGHSATLGYNIDAWQKGTYDLVYRYEDTTNLVSYTRILNMLTGEHSSIIAYPNFSQEVVSAHDNVLSSIERTYRLLEGQNMVGFGYIWLKNGQLIMRNAQTGQDNLVESGLQELETEIGKLKQTVDQYSATVDQEIERGFQAIENYQKTKCKVHRALFSGDEVNAVCEYLTEFKNHYEQMQQAQQLRSENLDSFKQQQQQRLQELEQRIQGLKSSLKNY